MRTRSPKDLSRPGFGQEKRSDALQQSSSMSMSERDTPSRGGGARSLPTEAESGDWHPTGPDSPGPATQFAQSRDEYLGEVAREVGRQTGTNEHELFVSCNPAPALQQQFEHLQPEFIAVHDIGTASSRKLLASLASAIGRPTQRLVIRRQAYGTALATVHFVELPSTSGTRLRMYSTDCDTEPVWRQSIAHMLLAFSRLGVIMVGDLKATDIAASIIRLRDSMLRGPWENHQLLLLPLGSASSLVNHGMELARDLDVNVRTTPQVARPADAWGFISGAWNRLTEKDAGAKPSVPSVGRIPSLAGSPGTSSRDVTQELRAPTPAPAASAAPPPASAATSVSPAATIPTVRAPSPAAPSRPADIDLDHAPPAAPPDPHPSASPAASDAPAAATLSLRQPAMAEQIRRYVRQISEIGGVVTCTIFDAGNGSRIAHAGTGPGAAEMAAQGAHLLAAILTASRALELGRALPDAAITLESHHLLLRGVPRHPGLALHVVLDKAKANLTLARLQVLRLDTMFDEAP